MQELSETYDQKVARVQRGQVERDSAFARECKEELAVYQAERTASAAVKTAERVEAGGFECVWRRARKAGKTASRKAIVEWVLKNIPVPWDEIEDEPSEGAVEMLKYVKTDPGEKVFWEKYLGSFFSKTESEGRNLMEDDGRTQFSIIERLRASAVLPNGPEGLSA